MLREGSIVNAIIISDTTAANVQELVPTGKLLHVEAQRVFDGAGCLGIRRRDKRRNRENVSWFIANQPSSRKTLDEEKLKAGKIKASLRAKAKYPFRYIKQVCGYGQV